MIADDLQRLFDLGHEAAGVEFKPPGAVPQNMDWYFAQIIRAVIGMANRRNGGHIVIGVEEEEKKIVPTGVQPADLATWMHDDVAAKIKKYVAPYVTLELQHLAVGEATFVAIYVNEFEEVPVLCDYDWQQVLTKGHLYVRSRGKPETTDRPTQVELRELLEIATDRGVERFVRRARGSGLLSTTGGVAHELDAFLAQRQTISSSDFRDELQTKGYWTVAIHPVQFRPHLIPYEALATVIGSARVSFRGWDFPHAKDSDIRQGNDWVSCDTDWQYYRESWQFFQSGQFVYIGGIHEDWADLSADHRWGPPPDIAATGPLLGVTDTIARFTEMFEFAGRLATKVEGWGEAVISCTLSGLRGRRLWFENPARRSPWAAAATDMDEFRYPLEARAFSADELLTEYQLLGREAAAEVFKRFGLTLHGTVLVDVQREAMRFGHE